MALLATGATPAEREPYLALGQRQYSEGNFEEAVFSLDTAVRRLAARPGEDRGLSTAYLLLGAAYLGLDQETLARAKFRRALGLDPQLTAQAEEFPPRVIKVLEEVRLELTAAKRRRGARKLLVVGGLGAVGAVGAGVAFGGHAPENRAPSGSIGVALEGQAIAGVTDVEFGATGADPDGDPITFSWDFGDGGTASGPSVTHVFTREGTLVVTLTVTDAAGLSGTSTLSVSSRSLNGVWCAPDCCADGSRNDYSDYQCVQTGSDIDCPRLSSTATPNVERWTGSLASPRSIDLQVFRPARREPASFGCRGEVTADLDSIRCVRPDGQLNWLNRGTARCQ